MSTLSDGILANRRLAILRILIEDLGHSNDSVLELALRELGHRAYLDRAMVRQMMRDLEQLDLVTIEMVRGTVMVAHLTPRGRMVAAGDCIVDGVASPHGGL